MATHYCGPATARTPGEPGLAADALKKTPADRTQIAEERDWSPELPVMRVIKEDDVWPLAVGG